ncbi:hypothetical protein PR048_002643 [Dryococelus australis]|uniref:Uncharacterized protein n=1 Tax=Dryococelus australis TaxID=614101 RepID=A0ABQ9IKW7_9NEOP|nr:hypothetical protein PR048_002643 [Dryococelus australis]
MYSMSEQRDMHYMYDLADGKALWARVLYAERFPNMQCPRTFSRIHQCLREIGSFERCVSDVGRPREVGSIELEERVLRDVDAIPDDSTRCIEVRESVSHVTVWRIMYENLLYLYHPQRVEVLKVADFEPRRTFCRRMLQKCVVFMNLLVFILFSDEADLTRNTNYHNSST